MKVLIAMDSFKGCLGSREAGEAVRDGVLAACPKAAITLLPLADGGEGDRGRPLCPGGAPGLHRHRAPR